MSDETVALRRVLTARGVASRREAEALIFEGKVTVDGTPAEHPAMPVTPAEQDIRVDGEPLPELPPSVSYLFYKPKGCITGRDDPDGRESVFDLIGDSINHRVEPVGRLDYDTEGALMLTNDGHLAHDLTHPSRDVPKRYAVKVWKTPSERALRMIRKGKVFLDDGRVPPCKVRILERTESGNAWVEITVTEGRNRLIRRLFAQLGHPVSKLRRESFATLSIRGMERGQLRPLTPDELRRVRDLAAGRAPEQSGRVRRKAGWARPKPKKPRPNQRRRRKGRGEAKHGGRS
jgi:23S rRNA pseudouridine2605 synthase